VHGYSGVACLHTAMEQRSQIIPASAGAVHNAKTCTVNKPIVWQKNS
jgi:hypothetical protein